MDVLIFNLRATIDLLRSPEQRYQSRATLCRQGHIKLAGEVCPLCSLQANGGEQ